jgi:hypothetical protein
VQQIEGKEQEAVRRFVDGRPEGFKVGDAVLVWTMTSPSISAAL